MTAQQEADLALSRWQSLRHLPPDERMSILFRDYWSAPVISFDEYEATLRQVDACMTEAA